jgi:hypothetical protein
MRVDQVVVAFFSNNELVPSSNPFGCLLIVLTCMVFNSSRHGCSSRHLYRMQSHAFI